MSASEPSVAGLVAALRSRGVELWEEDGKLRFRAAKGLLSAAELEKMKASKDAILTWLRERESSNVFALSTGQMALRFVHELAPGNPAYNLRFVAEIDAEIDSAVVELAINRLIERHAALRTSIERDIHGNPVQRIADRATINLEHVDSPVDEAIAELLAVRADEPFDLANGPLLRATLITRHKAPSLLSITLHHIVLDLVSLDRIVAELTSILAGNDAAEIVPVVDARDFVRWEQDMLASPAGEAHWAFWRERLADASDTLDMPVDRPRPDTQTFDGDVVVFELDDETAARARSKASTANVTPYMLILTVWQMLLARYSGQDRFLVGTPTAGRSEWAFENTVGYFVNPVPLRVMLEDDPGFGVLLERTREEIASAIEHQDYPFPLLIERLNPQRDPGRTPLFSVEFAWERMCRVDASAPLRLLSAEQRGASFELSLVFFDNGTSFTGALRYNTALFDRDTVARLAANFKILLDAALANPDVPVSQLDTMTSSEKHRVLETWNETVTPYPGDLLLQTQFERNARETPGATAVVTNGGTLSYAELDARANQLAHALIAHGIGRDQAVAVHMERSVDMVVALYATLKAGGAYVPVDPDYPAERTSFVLEETGACVVLTQQHLAGRLPETTATVLTIDADDAGHTRLDTTAPDIETGPDDLAYIIYTSGSTGKPKGVMNTHRGICNRLLWMQSEYTLETRDCVIQKTPYTFDVSVWEFFWPLQNGARLAVLPPESHKDPAALARFIDEHNVTVIHFVPPMLAVFLESAPACPSLRSVFASGEALPAALAHRFHELFDTASLHNLYGPTEAAVDVTYWPCQRGDLRGSIPIGRPVANTQIYILDKNRAPVPAGAVGEIYIGGVQVARGYINRPDLTRKRFVDDPFGNGNGTLYRTGDLGRHSADGFVEYLGRTDHQVKLRGLRIELGEIESTIRDYANVSDAVVIAREDRPGNKRLAAYVVPGESFDEPSLRAFLARKLPDYMIPPDIVTLDEIPLSVNGKINRRSLPVPATDTSKRFIAARDENESAIAGIWAETLGVERVGIDDNFFDLGGHSLLLAQVQAKLRERFSKELSYIDLFRHPTVGSLAALFDKDTTGDVSAADRARERAQRQRERLSRQRGKTGTQRGSRRG